MARYIDADALKKKAQMRGHVCKNAMVTEYRMCVSTHDIDEAPTVDAEPVRHGRWEKMGEADYKCSLCGFRFTTADHIEMFPYCRCGAKMDEVK